MYKEGDEEHYGAMLMGMESDAHGVMNQMEHTHDIHATPENWTRMSELLGMDA